MAPSHIHHAVMYPFSRQLAGNKMEIVHQSNVTAVIKIYRKPINNGYTLSYSSNVLTDVKMFYIEIGNSWKGGGGGNPATEVIL